MKSMKRLSVLVALILCLTIGGVYATWTYAGIGEITLSVSKGVNLTPSTVGGSAATYDIDPSDVLIQIDQTTAGDYTPLLQFNKPETATTARVLLKLIPSDTANVDIETNGIKSYVTFSSTAMYDSQEIFKFSNEPIVVDRADGAETFKWVKQADGTFTCEITAATLAEKIRLNDAAGFYLDTIEKYTAFDNALLASNINIKISDKNS